MDKAKTILSNGQIISIEPAKLPDYVGVQSDTGKKEILYLTNCIDRDVPDYVPFNELG